MNTAAHCMIAATGAPSSHGKAPGRDCALEGPDRPVAAERSFDAAAEPPVAIGPDSGLDDDLELVQAICRDMHACGDVCILLSGRSQEFLPVRYHPAYANRANVSSFSWVQRQQLAGTGITAICTVPGIDSVECREPHDEIVERVTADARMGWNRLQAAMAAFLMWSGSLMGFDRS